MFPSMKKMLVRLNLLRPDGKSPLMRPGTNSYLDVPRLRQVFWLCKNLKEILDFFEERCVDISAISFSQWLSMGKLNKAKR